MANSQKDTIIEMQKRIDDLEHLVKAWKEESERQYRIGMRDGRLKGSNNSELWQTISGR